MFLPLGEKSENKLSIDWQMYEKHQHSIAAGESSIYCVEIILNFEVELHVNLIIPANINTNEMFTNYGKTASTVHLCLSGAKYSANVEVEERPG